MSNLLKLTDFYKGYQSKDAKQTKTFDALDWLAAMCSHVPNRGEQMIRYYGYYSNVSRGKRKKKSRPPLKIHFPPAELYTDYSDSQIPPGMITRHQYHTQHIVSHFCSLKINTTTIKVIDLRVTICQPYCYAYQ